MSINSKLRMAVLSIGVVTCAGIVPAFADNAQAAPAAATSPATAPTTRRSSIEQYEDLLGDLKLSPEQQTKIDAIAAKTKEEYKANAATKDATVAQVRKLNIASYDKMKKEIAELLTTDQHLALSAKVRHIQLAAKKRIFEKVEPKLTEDQQKKIDAAVDDAEKKLDALDAEKIKNGTDVHDKEVAVSEDMIKQFEQIAPEQTKALEKKK